MYINSYDVLWNDDDTVDQIFYACILVTTTTTTTISIIIIYFMQSIYTYIPEINHAPREHSVPTLLLLLFMVLTSLVPALTPLYLYVSTFRSMCAVPNMAVISWYVAHVFSK